MKSPESHDVNTTETFINYGAGMVDVTETMSPYAELQTSPLFSRLFDLILSVICLKEAPTNLLCFLYGGSNWMAADQSQYIST